MRPETKSFEAGPFLRRAVVFLVRVETHKHLRRLCGHSSRLMSALGIWIKARPDDSLVEANALRFVAEHTSIPVPKVYCSFVHKGCTYIVMSKIKGTMACNGWVHRNEQSKQKILGQLREMIAELRAVPPPAGTGVSSVGNGPFFDCRLPSELYWGPFATARNFHEALVEGFNIDRDYTHLPSGLPELFQFCRQPNTQLVLTHGDLSSFNIMVEGDEVTGIIDWETAGWFPPYWEYTCAKNANPHNLWWADEVDAFVEPMPYELKMDRIRLRYFGPFGVY
ncbi:kinase-like domain-containing protein [Nemania serpens]|nr:kinase-like domain-containing protein [Nemania serpens]